MESSYQYSPIKNPNTIRLILLEPSPDLEAELSCSLIQTSLDDANDYLAEAYVALSYVWGDPSLCHTVAVDGQTLEITASLHCALRHLREPARVLRLWADGICINQKDNEDKNQQVRLMGSIYEHAQHTIIFLGPSTPENQTMIDKLAIESQNFDPQLPNSLGSLDERRQKMKRQHGSNKDEENIDSHFTTMLNDILSHPWFSRVWVLQELVLSRDPWVQRGQRRMRWNQFCQFAILYPFSDARRARGMFQIRHEYNDRLVTSTSKRKKNKSAEAELSKMLSSRRGAGVSDPRDMIYAHLGMLRQPLDPPFEIDYNKTVADVYEDLACRIMRDTDFLDIFRYLEDTHQKKRSDLPSWVPDWTAPHSPRPIGNYLCATSQVETPISVPLTIIFDVYFCGHIKYIVDPSLESGPDRDQGPTSADDFPPLFKDPLNETIESLQTAFKNSGSDPLRDRITAYTPKDLPETIYEAHQAICSEHFDRIMNIVASEVAEKYLTPDIDLQVYIKKRFNLSGELTSMGNREPPFDIWAKPTPSQWTKKPAHSGQSDKSGVLYRSHWAPIPLLNLSGEPIDISTPQTASSYNNIVVLPRRLSNKESSPIIRTAAPSSHRESEPTPSQWTKKPAHSGRGFLAKCADFFVNRKTPSRYHKFCVKSAVILQQMEDLKSMIDNDDVIAVLQSGACVRVTKHAQIEDNIFRLGMYADKDCIIIRPTLDTAGMHMRQRLQKDSAVENLSKSLGIDTTFLLMLGQFVAFADARVALETPHLIKQPGPLFESNSCRVLLALH